MDLLVIKEHKSGNLLLFSGAPGLNGANRAIRVWGAKGASYNAKGASYNAHDAPLTCWECQFPKNIIDAMGVSAYYTPIASIIIF